MNPLSISRLIFDTIPQLYEARAGQFPVDLKVSGEKNRVYSLVKLSPALEGYLDHAASVWEELSPMTEGEISQIIEREWIQQKFVIAWLESQTRITQWTLILDYVRRLSRRFPENQAMTKTMVIEPGYATPTSANLADPEYFKVLDWLGSSDHTFFRVAEDLGIKSFESPALTLAEEAGGFRFYPDALHPIISGVQSSASAADAVVVHLASNGSILIANSTGLIASKRALESWTVYDIEHVIDSVGAAMAPQLKGEERENEASCVACSLFQILFNISMKRHGGLLIVDRPQNLSQYVIKGIERREDAPLGALFTQSAFNGQNYSPSDVRKLVELSTIDGALCLDPQGNLLQVGSMIMSHPSTPNRFGMREAAAYSAARHGASAFKVSSDGHMSLFFSTPDLTGKDVHQFDFR